MLMKKLLIILTAVFMLTGCNIGGNSDEDTFTISFDDKEKYKEQIYNLMYDYYWRYDDTTVEFFSSSVPENTDENIPAFEASDDIGLNLKRYAGESCVVATLNLQHFNGDYAGRGYYYFNGGKLSGAYYTSSNGDDIYSFNTRNIFINSPAFEGYESDEKMADFKEYRSFVESTGFSDTSHSSDGKFIALSVNGNYMHIYKYANDRLIKYKSVYLTSEGLVPLSATFLENNGVVSGAAVIMGERIDASDDESENTYTVSKKVVFLNDSFGKTGEEMLLENSSCNYIFEDEGNLAIFAGENIEYYQKSETGWVKFEQYRLGHTANHVHITDLDGDGTKEYIMTDGFDLYMYRKSLMGYINIWRTHITVENYTGYIYSGDLNNDGIKEIYVSDTTGTAVRYILSKTGLVTSNEDIEYGNNLYPADFDGDGKDDYIKIFFGENVKQSMCIQQ